mgnify:CR=1 FL=1
MELAELISLHTKLAEWHETESKKAALDVVHEHHAETAERLRDWIAIFERRL